MNKGLEALERVRKAHYVASAVMQLSHEDTETIKAIDIIEKELKALEIIRREPSMVCWQASYDNYEEYIDGEPELRRYIKNKEEFDLLKEVLL